MKKWVVTWEIDIEEEGADTPEGAARKALEVQRDGHSTAVVFVVQDKESGQRWLVDLIDGTVKEWGPVLPF